MALHKEGERCGRCGDVLDLEDEVYQCQDCLAIYCFFDAEFQTIDEGVPCSLCGSIYLKKTKRENII